MGEALLALRCIRHATKNRRDLGRFGDGGGVMLGLSVRIFPEARGEADRSRMCLRIRRFGDDSWWSCVVVRCSWMIFMGLFFGVEDSRLLKNYFQTGTPGSMGRGWIHGARVWNQGMLLGAMTCR